MVKHDLALYPGGWFIGAFQPTLAFDRNFEVAVKRYKAGDIENPHYHRKAIEFTVIVQGSVIMGGERFEEGDIVEVAINEKVGFEAITDAITAVVKMPSVPGDKHYE